MESVLTKNQKKVFGPKIYTEDGHQYKIAASVRYDDQCGNGHNSFGITGDIRRKASNGIWVDDRCGCIHEDIAKHFPELKPFIKWHFMGSDGPMGYIGNTTYHAGEKDCWGKLKGEPYLFRNHIRFGDFPMTFKYPEDFTEWIVNQCPKLSHLEVEEIAHPPVTYKFSPKYTFKGFSVRWHECPFDTRQEAEEFRLAFVQYGIRLIKVPTAFGEGKEPNLEAARRCAIWPDATLEQLRDEKLLRDRLPALLAEFKKDVESLGFVY